MLKEFGIWSFIILCIANVSHAQSDSVHLTETVVITESLFRYEDSGNRIVRWKVDSLESSPSDNLGVLLSQSGEVYIKSYTPGLLSTSSLRGGQAGHSLVLWNGLPIQSPLVGQLDLSLINPMLFDQLGISKGGQSSMWGSGAIGGVINLDDRNTLIRNNSYSLNVSTGSFGRRRVSTRLNFANKRLSSSSRYSFGFARNDYPYRKAQTVEHLTNARQKTHNLKQDILIRADDKTKIAFRYWGIISERQIPPITIQNKSVAFQDDDIHRFSTEFKRSFKNAQLNAKLAYFNESLLYKDTLLQEESKTGFATSVLDISYETSLGKGIRWMLGFTHLNNSVKQATRYPDGIGETRNALFAKIEIPYDRLTISLGGRQEILDNSFLSPVSQLSMNYVVNRDLKLAMKFSRNYRYPSINDRFWIPGGRADLDAESGWSSSIGMAYRKSTNKAVLECSVDGFNRILDNWILWSPGNQTSFWQASNLGPTWSRGVELRLKYSLSSRVGQFNIRGGLDYIKSSSQESISIPNIEKGEQLWYVPERMAFINFSLKTEHINIDINYNYTSETRGLNADIQAFQLTAIGLTKSFKLNHSRIDTWFRLDNIFNKDYRVIEFRPMPGRNFELGFGINFEK